MITGQGYRYFNSSMVRLKVCSKRCKDGFGGFQFQYGAIEGSTSLKFTISVITFQFQYGAIEGVIKYALDLPYSEFQFQYGAIEGPALHPCSGAAEHISIPVWCD